MGKVNAIRVAIQEGAYTFTNRDLAYVLLNMDSINWGHGMFIKFIRTDGLISRTEFYRDEAKTDLAIARDYDRVSGVGGLLYVDQVVTTFYESDGTTVDSIVSGFMERDLGVSGDDVIECCSGYFDTSESEKL